MKFFKKDLNFFNNADSSSLSSDTNKHTNFLNIDKKKEQVKLNINNENTSSSRLAPIASSCETLGNSSSSGDSKSIEAEKQKLDWSKSIEAVENVLNKAIKVNGTDGILKKIKISSDLPTKSSVLNQENCFKPADNEIISDSESEPNSDSFNCKLNNKNYLASSNSSINDSISSAISTSNLTVNFLFLFYFLNLVS